MTIRQVHSVVKDARRLNLTGLDRAGYFLDRGVTLDEYRRYECAKTWLTLLVRLLMVGASYLAQRWLIATYGAHRP
jgi:hypothetical protein